MNTKNFEIKIKDSHCFMRNLIKLFLERVRPLGSCQEGEFSTVETNILFTDEIKRSEDGFWSYKQYDYSVNDPKFLSYESCTGSKIILTDIMNHQVIIGKNVGPNTFENLNSVLEEIDSEISKWVITTLSKL